MDEQEIDDAIKILQRERTYIRSRKWWTCPDCSKRTRLSELKVLVLMTQRTIDPPIWIKEARPEYHVMCSKCHEYTRLSGIVPDSRYKLVNSHRDVIKAEEIKGRSLLNIIVCNR